MQPKRKARVVPSHAQDDTGFRCLLQPRLPRRLKLLRLRRNRFSRRALRLDFRLGRALLRLFLFVIRLRLAALSPIRRVDVVAQQLIAPPRVKRRGVCFAMRFPRRSA